MRRDDVPPPPATPGAVPTASGVVVTVCAPDVERLEVEWAPPGAVHPERTPLHSADGWWWSGVLAGAPVGTRYGLRAHGPWAPHRGARTNPAKLLLDPQAHALDGPVHWHPDLQAATTDGHAHPADSARRLPRGLVVETMFGWGADAPPRTSWSETVIYEAHVKGLTMRHPDVPPEARGRYAGLAHPAVLEHLRGLGVTAVQLLPVQQAGRDRAQVERRIGNYWGYAPALWAAPDGRFASAHDGRQVAEFQAMVQACHAAGLEVLLDVVFNHTLEGDPRGAVLHFRGLADGRVYRRDPERPEAYLDVTGCGHAVAADDPFVQRQILDALRWWAVVCRVDGFRFDLAATLARGDDGFRAPPALLLAIAADPVLRDLKLIAEPWDLGTAGYRLGQFPVPFVEWNDRARIGLRRFWLGDGDAGELARRTSGSDDVFAPARGPLAGVTYVAAHDGFSLSDLGVYATPRTQANAEHGADALFAGGSYAFHVADGPVPALDVEAARDDRVRGLLATLLLSLGVPMLSQGDEVLQDQLGNANPYCHDSPLTWHPWTRSPRTARVQATIAAFAAARRADARLRTTRFRTPSEIRWHLADGRALVTAESWAAATGHLCATLPGTAGGEALLLVWNATDDALDGPWPVEGVWEVLAASGDARSMASSWRLAARAVGVWRRG